MKIIIRFESIITQIKPVLNLDLYSQEVKDKLRLTEASVGVICNKWTNLSWTQSPAHLGHSETLAGFWSSGTSQLERDSENQTKPQMFF